MLASPTQRHIGAVSEQIECLSVGRQITLGDQDLRRAKRDLLSNAAWEKKVTKKCYNLRLDRFLSGRLQGLCHAMYKGACAAFCPLMLGGAGEMSICVLVGGRSCIRNAPSAHQLSAYIAPGVRMGDDG